MEPFLAQTFAYTPLSTRTGESSNENRLKKMLALVFDFRKVTSTYTHIEREEKWTSVIGALGGKHLQQHENTHTR